jgi:hypothetical protein
MFGKEPSVIVGGITGLVTAILGLLVAFKVPLTPDQQVAILGVVAVIAPFIASIIIRQNVASPDTLRRSGTSLAQVTTLAKDEHSETNLRPVGPAADAPEVQLVAPK